MRHWHSEAPTWWTALTLPTGRAETVVEATDVAAACEVALRGHDRYGVTEARIMTSAAKATAEARPEPQELMSFAEIGELLGISADDAREVAATRGDFPPPVAQLGIGPVYTTAGVRLFREFRWP